ncbi:hypothetical protein [Spiroplasma endosymbiont of Panorpa germanica]|uniref:hypothetical protein n=1 Tax=Spiroplasma endosymbiont of Panorpa germanica TaxID=3066314 RepID=UPI0030D5A86A
MKKILSVFASIGLGLTPITTVVSCFNKPEVKEKQELTAETFGEWMANQNFGYEGDFYFLENRDPKEQSNSSIRTILGYKFENIIAKEIYNNFSSKNDDVWYIYVNLDYDNFGEQINDENPFESMKDYEFNYQLTIKNKNPNNKIELKYEDQKFRFKQTNRAEINNFNNEMLHHVLLNYDDFENDINNPFNCWLKNSYLLGDAKDEIISGETVRAKDSISDYLNKTSTGHSTSFKLPYEELYFTTIIDEIHQYEKVGESDFIRFKISATSTFAELKDKPEVKWEAIYII